MDPQLANILDLGSSVALVIMIGALMYRNIRTYRAEGFWNWSRTMIVISNFSNLYTTTARLIYNLTGFPSIPNYIDATTSPASIIDIIRVLMVVTGMMFVFYINEWDVVLFLPVYIYIGGIIFYIATGIGWFFETYLIFGGLFTLIMVYEAGFRVRDDDALGLGVYYSFEFAAFLLPSVLMIQIVTPLFGIIYAVGLFKPFELIEKGKQENKEESGKSAADSDIDDAPLVSSTIEEVVK